MLARINADAYSPDRAERSSTTADCGERISPDTARAMTCSQNISSIISGHALYAIWHLLAGVRRSIDAWIRAQWQPVAYFTPAVIFVVSAYSETGRTGHVPFLSFAQPPFETKVLHNKLHAFIIFGMRGLCDDYYSRPHNRTTAQPHNRTTKQTSLSGFNRLHEP